MEARCYGLARRYQPFMVNTVVGFIGPEYLYNHQQIIRAGLEDHFMGKLHGLPMGCDCCYTNHADTDQNSNENLMILLATAGVNFIISLPMGDDIMLNYQTNSFHDIATVRQLLNHRPAPEFGLMAGAVRNHGKRLSHLPRRGWVLHFLLEERHAGTRNSRSGGVRCVDARKTQQAFPLHPLGKGGRLSAMQSDKGP